MKPFDEPLDCAVVGEVSIRSTSIDLSLLRTSSNYDAQIQIYDETIAVNSS